MPNYNAGMGGIGAGIGGLFGQLFSNYKNPAEAGMPYLDQMSGQIPGIYGDYIKRGGQMGNQAAGQYSQLMNDPSARLNEIGAGYHESPGFQSALRNALDASNRSMAAGGMAGSPLSAYNSMQNATDLANQDYDKYMQNALGLYGTGLQGAQSMYGIGAQSSQSMGQQMADMAKTQAQLAFEGQNAQNQHEGGFWGGLGSGIGSLVGFL